MKKILLMIFILCQSLILIAQNPCPGVPTVAFAGQTYNTVQIGTQCWLKENLNVGTMILGSQDQTNNNIIEKYCYNDSTSNCFNYGGLYQWAEVVQYQNGATNTTSPNPAFRGNVQGICPNGWHIPTYVELQTLGIAVSNDANALKAIGQGTGSGVGTNTSGFSTLLSGVRGSNGYFLHLNNFTYYWSSTELGSNDAYGMILGYYDSGINWYDLIKDGGFSVRCCKDDNGTGVDRGKELPNDYSVSQNYPNPFNPITTINYSIPKSGLVTIKVYDVLGAEVTSLVNEYKPVGSYQVTFNAEKLSSGVYFYQLKTDLFVKTKKLILMK